MLSATAMLFQCPASFTPEPENVSRMRRFFERIERPSARLLWEPRGAKWVAERELALSLCSLTSSRARPLTSCSITCRE